MAIPILWQIAASHFNEKVRWALDFKGIAHQRRSVLPGLHIPRMLWLSGQKSLPVLILEGTAISDSTRIIEALERAHPNPPLYPADPSERQRALALEEHFDEELGPHIRRAMFYDLLPHTQYAIDLMTTANGQAARRVYALLFPVIRAAMKMDMGIDAMGAELGRQKTRAALDHIAAELQPSGYLVGDRFGVADLTAAALLSGLVAPPEFPYPIPPMPSPFAEFRQSLAGHKAFRWVADIYRSHRGVSREIAA